MNSNGGSAASVPTVTFPLALIFSIRLSNVAELAVAASAAQSMAADRNVVSMPGIKPLRCAWCPLPLPYKIHATRRGWPGSCTQNHREPMAERRTMTLQIHPLMDDFGAEVSGVDLAAADDATIDRLTERYYEHSLLILRDPHLPPGEQATLTARFGTPKIATRQKYNDPAHPTFASIGNLPIGDKPPGCLNRQDAH